MAKKKNKSKNKAVLELDMVEHAQRLRAIPGSSWEIIKTLLVWLGAVIILSALLWLTLGR
jgi:hypothetical protein